MKTVEYRKPWAFLDSYRGKEFKGEWPCIPELLHITALRFPERQAFRAFEPDEQYSYRELEEIVKGIAGYLQMDGVKPGDKLGVIGHNSPSWMFAYFATLYAGAVIVPLDNTLHIDELEHFMEFGGVSRLFCSDARAKALEKDGRLPMKRYRLETLKELQAPYSPLPLGDEDALASILFTSGTTGTPKGVMLTHKNLVSDCLLTQGNILITENDVIYAVLPLHHAYTMQAVVYMAISTGGSVVFGKKLAMSRIKVELKEGKVTMLMAVPMLYNKILAGLMRGVKEKSKTLYAIIRFLMWVSGILKRMGLNVGKKWFSFLLEKVSLENIRVCISGGGPLAVSTFRMYQQLGIDFVQGYGLTEASPITHLNPLEAFRLGSVGRKHPGEEVKIMDPDSDGNGIICIKGPMVMKGYYNNPEATEEVLTEDGWLNTGDVGHQDADGYLYLTGRAKSVIVTEGGKNVFPEEIEDKFQLYGEIEQICVIKYMANKERLSEGIAAVIVPQDRTGDRKAAEERISQIVDEVNRSLQSCKRITKVIISYDKLPMTSTSKVKRNEVQALYDD